MKRLLTAALAATLALPPAAPVSAGPRHCPPGLAKKNPPCVPPGLAKKGVRPGDHFYDFDHRRIDPDRHGLDPRYGWYRIGDDIVVRTDRETGEIIELMNALIAVLD